MTDLESEQKALDPVIRDGARKTSQRGRGRAPLSLVGKLLHLLREALIWLRVTYMRRVRKMDIAPDAKFSLRANLDRTNPRGIHLASGSYVAFDAVIFAHDVTRLLHTHTYIGRNCFIGARAIVLAGVRVGDHSIVGAGSVVTKDVPPGCIVAGNPARVIRSGIVTRKFGILDDIHQEIVAREAAEREAKARTTQRR